MIETLTNTQTPRTTSLLKWGPVVTVLAGLAGVWLAAEATALLGRPLRIGLTWSALAVAILADPTGRGRLWIRLPVILAGAAVAVVMTAWPLAPVRVLGVAVLLSALAVGRTDAGSKAILIAAVAAATVGVYQFACTCVPLVWMAADRLGGAMGHLVGWTLGRPMWLGATFAGLDFLILMAALYAGWLLASPVKRWPRGLWGAAAILAGHLIYLVVVAFAVDLRAALPAAKPDQPWTWTAAIRTFVPWNLPLLAGAIHLTIAAAMLRWTAWPAEGAPRKRQWPWWLQSTVWLATIAVAAGLVWATVYTPRPPQYTLEDKKIVVNKEGFFNWLKPQHGEYGQYSIGMYGLLPDHLEAMGAECVRSVNLSAEDLEDADVLIVIYPTYAHKDEWGIEHPGWDKKRLGGILKRVEGFVRRGGSLLVLGEHTTREAKGKEDALFNEVLEPAGMHVRFDSATSEVGGWLQSYQTFNHRATLGMNDERNELGVTTGGSVDAPWSARPLIVGRWGWADDGDPATSSMMGNSTYDNGEKLGDVLLAAEGRLGKGTVIAFGDTTSITDGIRVNSHRFISRLLGYLAHRPTGPPEAWRQYLGAALALTLIVLLFFLPAPTRAGAAALVIGVGLAVCMRTAYDRTETLPDGGGKTPNNLAYIDTAHMSAASGEGWRYDGTMGLAMTLMRNGYLTLDLPELTRDRLSRAGLLVSIAPARAFTNEERLIIRDFVEGGGIFICTVGYDRRGPSEKLLADFGFRIGLPPTAPGKPPPEPQPWGWFKSQYMQIGDYVPHVRYHAGWPVTCSEPGTRIIAYGQGDVPIILLRRVKRGKVVVVGDTCFAMNVNLERKGGEPFEGMRENADFWRWFLAYLTGRPAWLPRPPAPETAPAATQGQAENHTHQEATP